MRGGGIAEPGRKVPKWSPALGGLVCCSPILRGGGAEEGPTAGVLPVSPSAVCERLGA